MATETTQRAYTLRLKGSDEAMKSLWTTHEAVNKGVKAFGDWLLTLRGGLDHKLADLPVVDGKGDKKTERAPTEAERRNRRIVLALSWLSVESADGAPNKLVVAAGSESDPDRRRKVLAVFGAVLKGRGVKPVAVNSWVEDCRNSLSAAIRADAVWVDRSAAFDSAVKTVGKSLTRSEVWDLLGPFFVDAISYLAPAVADSDEETAQRSEEKAKDLVQKAGQWLSSRFGEGEGADFGSLSRTYALIANEAAQVRAGLKGTTFLSKLADALRGRGVAVADASALCGLTRTTGLPRGTDRRLTNMVTAENVSQDDIDQFVAGAQRDAKKCSAKTGSKGHHPYADRLLADAERACGFTYLLKDGPARHWEFSVMLDHAARHVSVAHSWQKLAEAERRQFAEDAARRAPTEVKKWLDGFLSERGRLTGAVGPMQVRRRAVDGWKDVVKAWSARGCVTAADRVQAARALQDELDKFGDIVLYEALAADDAKLVWTRDGEPDPQPLLDYVYARDAEFKMRRFKVPAYRHPDPLLHPVFCDFGKSRWTVSFAVHDAAMDLSKADAGLVERQKEVATAKSEMERSKGEARLLHAKKQRDAAASGYADARSGRGIELKLWDGKDFKPAGFVWQSKRLASDLALDQDESGGTGVSRADRAGRAAVGIGGASPVRILNVFEENDWAARLQAPRAQLDHLAARVAKRGWDRKALRIRDSLKWLVTFSARLQEQDNGPWPAYVGWLAQVGQAEAFSRKDAKGVYRFASWPHSEANKTRSGLARLDLCRLPALRILSVDLGHRYAAACAVWETLTEKEAARLCRDADRKPPKPDDIALHLVGKRGGKKVKVILRRTGPDMWARLDRQFLIKLQGEDEDPRKASPAEHGSVAALEFDLGRTRAGDTPLPWQVRDLMSDALRTARLGLRRHGDRARIAFNLTTDYKPMPGGTKQKLDNESRKALLVDTLALWQNLFSGNRWQDSEAKELWDKHVRVVLTPAPDEGASNPARRAWDKKVREALPDAATRLVGDPVLRRKLSDPWKARWTRDDKQWVARLHWLRDWLLPRAKEGGPGIRHVGGLSLDRLSSIRELYQLMKAHRTRPEPDDPRANVPDEGDSSLDKYGLRILDALERMRDNRVKQLASRLVEAALGIGRESRGGGPRPTTPAYEPCHAIVVENLDLYRPEQTRTRRENRQLMRWSAAKVLKYLRESCDLNGLYLRQVMPNYTSRQDSRTGAPGARCADMPVAEFLRRFGPKSEALAENGDAVSRYLVDLVGHWQKRPAKEQMKGVVRIPQDGADIFVSAEKQSPAAKGLQADLNAAANIGLRALLDPDWPGKWWWVPCDGRTSKPAKEKVKGSEALDAAVPLVSEWKPDTKEIVNLWRDATAEPVKPGGWKGYSEYWNGVKVRVVARLRERAGL